MYTFSTTSKLGMYVVWMYQWNEMKSKKIIKKKSIHQEKTCAPPADENSRLDAAKVIHYFIT